MSPPGVALTVKGVSISNVTRVTRKHCRELINLLYQSCQGQAVPFIGRSNDAVMGIAGQT
jgi:hypothetical protein